MGTRKIANGDRAIKDGVAPRRRSPVAETRTGAKCLRAGGAGQDAFSTGPRPHPTWARLLEAMAQGLSAPDWLRGSDSTLVELGGIPTDPPTRYPPDMSTRPRSQSGPPMTLGNMRANGVLSAPTVLTMAEGTMIDSAFGESE
jgi:hypothetical protein